MGGKGAAGRVGSHKRLVVLLADANNVPEAAVRQVGDVDDNAHLIHRVDHLTAKWFERQRHLFRIEGVGITQAVLHVPGDGDQTHTHLVHLFQALALTADAVAVLRSQKAGKFSLPLVADKVVAVAGKGGDVAVFFQILVQTVGQSGHKLHVVRLLQALFRKALLRHQAHGKKLRGKSRSLHALKVDGLLVFVQVHLFSVGGAQQGIAVHIDQFQDKSLQI